jgi:hypothetical protein
VFVGIIYSYFNDILYRYFLFENLVNFNEKKISLTKVSIDEFKNKNLETNNDNKFKEKDIIKEKNIIKEKDNRFINRYNILLNFNNVKSYNENISFKHPKEIDKNNNNEIIIEPQNKNIGPQNNNIESQNINIGPQNNNVESQNINIESLNKNIKFKISEEQSQIQFDYLNTAEERVGLYYYLRTLCKKNKLLNKVGKMSEKLDNKIDVLYYLRNVKTLKLIEEILFDEKQVNLLKLISKKTYFISSSEEEESEKNQKKLFIQDSNEFKQIIESIDHTDKKNIKLLNEIFELKEN